MKKNKALKIGIIFGLCLALIGSLIVFSAPGGTDDPVVTKSYIIDKVIPEIKTYIDQRLGIISEEDTVTARPATFTVVNLNPGQSVIGEAGTELIAKLPIIPSTAKLCDEGCIEDIDISLLSEAGEKVSAKIGL